MFDEQNPAPRAGGNRAGIRLTGQQSITRTTPQTQETTRRLRRQRAIECAHHLGARAIFEFVDELARHHPEIADDIDGRLAAYAERLTPDLLRAIGGDRFPMAPMRAIGGRR